MILMCTSKVMMPQTLLFFSLAFQVSFASAACSLRFMPTKRTKVLFTPVIFHHFSAYSDHWIVSYIRSNYAHSIPCFLCGFPPFFGRCWFPARLCSQISHFRGTSFDGTFFATMPMVINFGSSFSELLCVVFGRPVSFVRSLQSFFVVSSLQLRSSEAVSFRDSSFIESFLKKSF